MPNATLNAMISVFELRHPGAHDQSVHNPHKSGPAAMPTMKSVGSASPDELIGKRKMNADGTDFERQADANIGNREIMAEMYAERGFNAKPQVVSQQEFDAIDGPVMYRGVGKKAYAEDFVEGDLHRPGDNGWHGSGTYAAANVEGGGALKTAANYAMQGSEDPNAAVVITMKLAPDAKVITQAEVGPLKQQLYDRFNPELTARKADLQAKISSGKLTGAAADVEVKKLDLLKRSSDAFYTDDGAVATFFGYDAIRVGRRNPKPGVPEYVVILNRGKAIINGDAPDRPTEEQ